MAATGYWREISTVLALKGVLLALIYALIVVPNEKPPMTPGLVAQHLAGSPAGLAPGSSDR
jgi:hypothetical protein